MNQAFGLVHINDMHVCFCTYFFVLICTVNLSKANQGQIRLKLTVFKIKTTVKVKKSSTAGKLDKP